MPQIGFRSTATILRTLFRTTREPPSIERSPELRSRSIRNGGPEARTIPYAYSWQYKNKENGSSK